MHAKPHHIVDMPDTRKMPMRLVRLALREEGKLWNAYAAQASTMQGAFLIGSIAADVVNKHEHIREAFKALMIEVIKVGRTAYVSENKRERAMRQLKLNVEEHLMLIFALDQSLLECADKDTAELKALRDKLASNLRVVDDAERD